MWNHDLAIADYTQAIRIDPNLASAFSNRGNVHFFRGDFDLAIADHEAVLRINPSHPHARQWLEEARQLSGR